MDATTETRATGTLTAFLAGLQGGMVGVLWMLAWLGVSATWQRRSFWTAENLLASAFYGDTAIRDGFAFSTLSGLALYLLVYSILGALFAAAIRERARFLLCRRADCQAAAFARELEVSDEPRSVNRELVAVEAADPAACAVICQSNATQRHARLRTDRL